MSVENRDTFNLIHSLALEYSLSLYASIIIYSRKDEVLAPATIRNSSLRYYFLIYSTVILFLCEKLKTDCEPEKRLSPVVSPIPSK